MGANIHRSVLNSITVPGILGAGSVWSHAPMATDPQQHRRSALRRWMDTHVGGNASALARRLGRSPAQINDVLAGRKSFGEKFARFWSRVCRDRRGGACAAGVVRARA